MAKESSYKTCFWSDKPSDLGTVTMVMAYGTIVEKSFGVGG